MTHSDMLIWPYPGKKSQTTASKHWPIFIILVTIIDIGVLISEIVYNGGLENFQVNPFVRTNSFPASLFNTSPLKGRHC